MPIPVNVPRNSINSWMFNQRRVGHQRKFCLLPRRCYLSNRSIWLKRCEVIICMITGPSDTLFETYWCDPKEFLLNELKR